VITNRSKVADLPKNCGAEGQHANVASVGGVISLETEQVILEASGIGFSMQNADCRVMRRIPVIFK
jgi:hypothetical protein